MGGEYSILSTTLGIVKANVVYNCQYYLHYRVREWGAEMYGKTVRLGYRLRPSGVQHNEYRTVWEKSKRTLGWHYLKLSFCRKLPFFVAA